MSAEANLDRKVLVVEDEPDLRELLTYNLTAAGFNVQATENGTDGLAAVQKFAPDVVLLDLMLPDIPGTEVCRRIRGGEVGGRQPAVMMLTAKGEEIDRVVGNSGTTLSTGRSISEDDMSLLRAVDSYLSDRFGRHLNLLRHRAERT